jgi:mitogen-activated protein kinase organizer 1
VGLALPKTAVARLIGHDGPVQTLRFTGDGKYCLTGGHDRSIRLWNPTRLDPAFPPLPSGTSKHRDQSIAVEALPRALPIQAYTDGYTHPISSLALDQKSSTLVAASGNTLIVTDVVTKRVKRRYQGHAGRINAVAISDNCETFLSASYDATVCVWDGRASRSHTPIQIFKEAKDSVSCMHLDQTDGNAVIMAGSVDGAVRSYDLRKGQIRCDQVGGAITCMAPTYDDKCLAVSCLDGTIRLIELDTGELLNTYSSHHKAGMYGLECCLTADDATIVSGSENGDAVLYDLVRATPIQILRGHRKPTCTIAAHPSVAQNSVILTGSYDGNAVVWAHESSFMRWEE